MIRCAPRGRIYYMPDGPRSPDVSAPKPLGTPESSKAPNVLKPIEAVSPLSPVDSKALKDVGAHPLIMAESPVEHAIAESKNVSPEDLSYADQVAKRVAELGGGEVKVYKPGEEIPSQGVRESVREITTMRGMAGYRRGGNGDGNEPPGEPPPNTPEGPRGRGPENVGSPEFEERGRQIAEKIILMETGMSYEVRYNETNGPILDQLYKDLQEYVDITRVVRNERDPLDVWIRDNTGKAIDYRGNRKKGITAGAGETENEAPEGPVRVENLPARSMEDLMTAYVDFLTPPDQIPVIEREIGVYLNEARRLGLLTGVDNVLNSILREDVLPRNPHVGTTIGQRLQYEVQPAFRSAFIAQRSGEEPEIAVDLARLAGKWNMSDWTEEGNPVLIRARTILERFLADEPLPTPIEGEWRLGENQNGAGRQTFYEAVRNYPKMYYIFARTPEQFQIAKRSFLQALKNGAVGDDPEKLLPHMQAFTEVFGTRGQEMIVAGTVSPDFMKDERHELEGRAYGEGAEHSAETYNPQQFHNFMMALALNGGPERFIRMIRSGSGPTGEGQVGHFAWQFDYNPMIWLWYNSGGSRGQIGNDYQTQKYLRGVIQDMVIEAGMGVRLKDYDPTKNKPEPEDLVEIKNYEKGIAEALKANQERIGVPQSVKDFKDLYEGFDTGDAHIQNYEEYVVRRGVDPAKLPSRLQVSVALGKAQKEFRRIRQEVRDGRVLPAGETIMDQLEDVDRGVYKEAYDEAKANFETALMLTGITGEKVRRGGGVLFVDRNEHVQSYRKKMTRHEARLRDEDYADLLPMHTVNEGSTFRPKPSLKRKKVSELTKEEREVFDKKIKDMSRADKKTRLLKKKRGQWSDSEWLGWMLATIRKGADIKFFTEEEQRFYRGEGTIDEEGKFVVNRLGVAARFNNKDREDVVDVIPEDLAKRLGQYAVTRAKVECANTSESVRGQRVFDYLTKALDEFDKDGYEAKLVFPKILFDAEGNVTGVSQTETETITFQQAIDHIYSRSTNHTYWFYQLNNRQPLLNPKLIAEAKLVRAGLKQPDEVDQLSALLFNVDPTLRGMKRLHQSEMHDETNAVAAAVEQSFMDSCLIQRMLYKRFLPTDDNRNKIRMGYTHEDFGGFMRFVGPFVPFVASHSKRFDRRYLSQLYNTPMYVPSMAQAWAKEGVMGAVEMFSDGMGELADQRLAGQFAITKFIDEIKYGWMLNQAFLGYTNERGENIEGLLEKPTNSAEEINSMEHAIKEYLDNRATMPTDAEEKLLKAYIKSFGRLERVMKIMRVMYSDVRNSQGTTLKTRYDTDDHGQLVVKSQDIFLEDGSFNPAIDWEKSGPFNSEVNYDANTGSSRHILAQFFESYIKWLVSTEDGGGVKAYPNEAHLYSFLMQPTSLDATGKTTRWEWIFGKMCR